jgi:hypothetical protein
VPATDVQLEIIGPGIDAKVTISGVAAQETIHVNVVVSGNTATLDSDDRRTPDNNAQVEGKITAIGAGTLTIGSTMVTVPSGTPIVHGDTPVAFLALFIGERVHAKATNTGGVLTATKIEVQNELPPSPTPTATPSPRPSPTPEPGDDDNQGDEGNGAEVSGTVSALSGTCPSLTFTVRSTKVMTNASTQFKGVACSALANGSSVDVEGTRQTNGSVLATHVGKDD